MSKTDHTRPPRQEGNRLMELRRSNASGIHQDRRTKRARGRRVQKLTAIRESVAA